jgi:ABC-type multidrug transport system fused ATPase/permease subunit
MAFTVDPQVSTVFIYTIPVLSVIVFGVMLAGIPLYKRVQSHLDNITSKTRENLSGARMLRALCKENSETAEFNDCNALLSRSQRFAGRVSALMNPLTFVIINLAIALLVYKGGVKVEHGGMSNAQVIVIYNYMSSILVELIKLANLIISITKALACANRVSAVLEIKNDEISEVTEKIDDNGAVIDVSNVTFGYSKGGAPAIKDVSFRIGKGQTVGIIGGTGSGKSTLINLICGLYHPEKGSVVVLGKDVNNSDKDELLNEIGIVPQKSELFCGTIRSNLAFGNSNATDNELYAALDVAVAKEFVDKLSDGLDSHIEQYGRNLSGGQRQRLAIARAIVKKPKILILDDSSSALDYSTDLALRRNISQLDSNMTVINVSQRAASIKHSDVILVLDEGELVGSGSHEELYSECLIYREICQSQERR